MECFNLKNPAEKLSFTQAIVNNMGSNKGLYFPSKIPLASHLLKKPYKNFTEIATDLAPLWLGDEMPEAEIKTMVKDALSFPIPLVNLSSSLAVLELWHGPTLAFKDIGARFLAGMISYLLKDQTKDLLVAVATSGDTGAAVARAFLNKPKTKVVLLYPAGKVSPIQEKTLTTLGSNVTAVEVKGSFDDCQSLVKDLFADENLKDKYCLASGNSINLGRLLPQSFYYMWLATLLKNQTKPVTVVVPSGNLGNLTAGVMAKRMGAPIDKFICANNANDAFYRYLQTANYQAEQTVSTISNAMDVGDPSNFPRLIHLFNNDHKALKAEISGYRVEDEQTKQTIAKAYKDFSYTMCPHTAVSYAAWQLHKEEYKADNLGVLLATAHPGKFNQTVEDATNASCPIPLRLKEIMAKPKESVLIEPEYEQLKAKII